MTKFAMMALSWLLAGGMAQAQQDSTAQPQRSVKLTKVIADIPVGTPYLSLRYGALCVVPAVHRTWVEAREAQKISPYYAPFRTELEQAGFKVVIPGEDNLFDSESGSADYEAAAVITDEHVEGCISKGSIFSEGGKIRGEGSMTIDWQIFSPIEKRVVAHVHTTGTSRLEESELGGLQKLVVASFGANARQLAADADFRAAMSAPKALKAGFQMPGQQSKIALAGSLKAGPRQIADAVGSVVTVMNSSGSGSGVLVSSDGYFLTNAHVVGDDKEVRVRWSDGIEGVAQVERISKNRDIAIIKADPRDRTPLAIKRGPVTPGTRVYAIGSPNGKAFQGTVSSGVISAERVIDGLRYIQSDTSISPGSSGGALLDESGSVVGVTVSHYLNEGQPAGLNMFIPIGDAMDFLSLEQK